MTEREIEIVITAIFVLIGVWLWIIWFYTPTKRKHSGFGEQK